MSIVNEKTSILQSRCLTSVIRQLLSQYYILCVLIFTTDIFSNEVDGYLIKQSKGAELNLCKMS